MIHALINIHTNDFDGTFPLNYKLTCFLNSTFTQKRQALLSNERWKLNFLKPKCLLHLTNLSNILSMKNEVVRSVPLKLVGGGLGILQSQNSCISFLPENLQVNIGVCAGLGDISRLHVDIVRRLCKWVMHCLSNAIRDWQTGLTINQRGLLD